MTESAQELPKYVLFFDGECVLCNGTVQWLFTRERDGQLAYASLQGATAAALRSSRADFPEGLETFVFYDGGDLHVRSRAMFRAARLLKWPWRWGRFLAIVPRFLSDLVYRWVAKNRLRWFGRTTECWLPPAGEGHRFLP